MSTVLNKILSEFQKFFRFFYRYIYPLLPYRLIILKRYLIKSELFIIKGIKPQGRALHPRVNAARLAQQSCGVLNLLRRAHLGIKSKLYSPKCYLIKFKADQHLIYLFNDSIMYV